MFVSAEGRPRRRRGLAGRVAAVTGGARGIGLATARALAAEGVRVAIGDLDREHAARAAADVGGGALGLELDVSDQRSFEAFLDETERRLGPLDVLVNNAGIMPIGPFLDEDVRTERGMVEVNVHGVMRGMRLALPGMIDRSSGHVVNIASTGGRVGVAGAATYCGTKFFVYGLSEGVRGELRGTGVELSCILPGIVRTELTSGLRQPRGMNISVEPEDVARAIVRTLERPRFEVFVPRRVGTVTRVAAMLPRGAREALTRLTGADRFFSDYDAAGRRAYEQRALRTAQHAEDRAEASTPAS
jgi:NADP-dependent 3-hydroxy acid dehydrogenase YdfG